MFSKFGVLRICRRFYSSTPSMNVTKRHNAVMIDGKKIASQILGVTIRHEIDKLKQVGVTPRLVAVLVGEVSESKLYVDRKKLTASKFGIDCKVRHFPAHISQEKLLQEINELNQDPEVHGVIVQLPLPPHLQEDVVCNGVVATKDVDGFSASNLGRLVQGGIGARGVFVPCTALAVATMLKTSFSSPTKGLRAVVAGRSHNVGLPIAVILSADAAKGGLDLSTTICHRYTQPEHLAQAVRQADIVVSATGVPGLIKPDFVKPGACVIDVGLTRVDLGGGQTKIFGDVDPAVAHVAGFLTPVPGGVGPCTVACLLSNTVQAATWATFN